MPVNIENFIIQVNFRGHKVMNRIITFRIAKWPHASNINIPPLFPKKISKIQI